jgi:hypothetical protein
MYKFAGMLATLLASLGLAVYLPAQPPAPGGPPAPKVKKGKGAAKKEEREPGGALRKAYDLLRRLRADEGIAGRSEERLREWTRAAAGIYRDGVRALNAGDVFRAREYGTAAHDLARAVDHARNAARFDRPDPDLPPPGDDFGLGDLRERARVDLYLAFQRIAWLDTWRVPSESDVYVRAAHELYSAGRRDVEAGRDERAGELARAAEAMTHVPEHLANAANSGIAFEFRPAPEREPRKVEAKGKGIEPPERSTFDLPPILPPR